MMVSDWMVVYKCVHVVVCMWIKSKERKVKWDGWTCKPKIYVYTRTPHTRKGRKGNPRGKSKAHMTGTFPHPHTHGHVVID